MKRKSLFVRAIALSSIVLAIAAGIYWKCELGIKNIDKSNDELTIVGWKEWVSLPDLGIKKIKAKVDSGAKTSSLHAKDMSYYQKEGRQFVRFTVGPTNKAELGYKEIAAEVLEYRKIKSSNGQVELRPVIVTQIQFQDKKWLAEITLTDRENMRFPMLLGRQAMKGRFLVNPGKSYLGDGNK